MVYSKKSGIPQEMRGILLKKVVEGPADESVMGRQKGKQTMGSSLGRARWGIAATPHSEGEVPEPRRIRSCRRASSGLD